MKNLNEVKIIGKVAGHDLRLATRRDGSAVLNDRGEQALSGKVTLQVDEIGTTVEVECFAYPTWGNGKSNRGYLVLDKIFNGDYDESTKLVSVGAEFSIEYYVSKRTGDISKMVRLRGRFFDEAKKDATYDLTWTADTILFRAEEVEANPEVEADAYSSYTGYISNYSQELSEMQFSIHDPAVAAKLPVESINADNPMYVILRGTLRTIPKTIKGTDAFGDEYEKTYFNKNWEITRIGLEPYDIYDDEILGIEAYTLKKRDLELKKEKLLNTSATAEEEQEELPF